MSEVDFLVIGGGHNGLVAACYLARAGYQVEVVEAAERVGGMVSTNAVIPEAPEHLINEGGMDFSTFRASTIATDLDLARFGFGQVEVDPSYAFLEPEGASLCIWRDAERTADEIRRFSRRDASAYLELANALDSAMDLIVPYMTTHPTRPEARRMLGAAVRGARGARRLASLRSFVADSHAEVIESRFEHPMIRGPLAALPCFSPITMDGNGWSLIYFGFIHRYGISRGVGGSGALTDALERCLLDMGGTVRTSARAEEIVVAAGGVRGVLLSTGELLEARAVISSANPKSTLTELLPAGTLPSEAQSQAERIPTASTHASSFKVDLALSGRVELSRHQAQRRDGVDLRKPVVGWASFDDHVAAWDACRRGVTPETWATLAILPTAVDPSQAPAGEDTFWLWTGIAPVDPVEPWKAIRDRAGAEAIEQASSYYDFGELEIGRKISTPEDISERFLAPDGNVYHVDVTSLRFGPLRPARGLAGYRTPVPGLFMTGAGTHPVAGICGIPGQLAARAAMRSIPQAVGSATRPEAAEPQAPNQEEAISTR